MAFAFPKKFTFDGQEWRKVYDPAENSLSDLPNMNTPKVAGVSGRWIELPYGAQKTRLYLAVVSLLYPAISSSANVQAAQEVRGIRFFNEEHDPTTVPPAEMVMYVRDVPYKDDTLQGFIYSMLGVAAEEAAAQIDRGWANTVLGNAAVSEGGNAQ